MRLAQNLNCKLTMAAALHPTKPSYTIKEAAAYLNLSPRTIQNLIQRKLLRRSKALRIARIPGEDVETFFSRTC